MKTTDKIAAMAMGLTLMALCLCTYSIQHSWQQWRSWQQLQSQKESLQNADFTFKAQTIQLKRLEELAQSVRAIQELHSQVLTMAGWLEGLCAAYDVKLSSLPTRQETGIAFQLQGNYVDLVQCLHQLELGDAKLAMARIKGLMLEPVDKHSKERGPLCAAVLVHDFHPQNDADGKD